MKIAIIGASGFIGRHLISHLLKDYLKPEINLEIVLAARNTDKLSAYNKYCQVVEFDIEKMDDCYNRLGKPDILLDLAWRNLSNYRSLSHIEVELPAHYQFIKCMVKAGVSSVCIAGTCFEYGMCSGALSEDTPTLPDNPYGYAKDALRQQLQYLKTEHDFKFTWMRLFYLYGEGQPDNTLYSQLRAAIVQKQPVFNMSGGEQLRDYLHVDAVVEKVALLTLKNQDIGVVNVCSGKPISIRRLVEDWLEKNNGAITLNLGYYPYPDYEPMAFWGSTEKMEKVENDRN
ncbi:NAD(P)-dependent oxidoreductase [Candidatus Venteria ishoeyi]|uniref:NAD-dependent epimerase/dehydratase family protein n=1 Tax=Candidatus Venteria ishoeyi TaxID=1899563 RepID=UPI0025A4FE61|nr:NAD(P)-dependent oxidoreductase [Candidatus Venteria ishoeyi]MDM8546568.1 NAD(P)-dependent oxidoreductase [Candidatus Venteria ishoeyi]